MKGQMGNLMKQAQKMQENMQKAQEEIANMEVSGQSGGGLVEITINGKHEVRKVTISQDALEDAKEDKEMLEDLVAAAMNDAVHKLSKASQEKMSGVTAGMPLPPGMKLPF